MEYMTIRETEEKRNISERRIRQLLQEERIEGAVSRKYMEYSKRCN